MFLVLGSALDLHPAQLVERWRQAGCDVALATPADLSRPGWRLRNGAPRAARAAVEGRVVDACEVDAVISLLPWVSPLDLPHVVEADRDYAASEMSAFLLAWLAELPCPVLDPPSTTSLAGCGRSSHEWAALAGRVGVSADPTWHGDTTAITMVGGRAVSDTDPLLARAGEAVAAAAGRSLVTLCFAYEHSRREPVLTGAAVRPELGEAAAADALLQWLEAS